MSGVSWGQRKEGDWLASNGRWYPSNRYPRGWNRTSLPPAPHHDLSKGVTDIVSGAANRVQQLINTAASGQETGPPVADSDEPAKPRYKRPPPPPRPNHSRPRTPAAPRKAPKAADATVTSQRTHMSRVGPGAPPPRGLPPAPGRIDFGDGFESELDFDDLELGGPDKSADGRKDADNSAGTGSSASTRPVAPPMPAIGDDLGDVFGSARRKLDEAVDGRDEVG